jgi:hypothetical protein
VHKPKAIRHSGADLQQKSYQMPVMIFPNRKTRDHNQFIAWDFNSNILQIVLASTDNANDILRHTHLLKENLTTGVCRTNRTI